MGIDNIMTSETTFPTKPPLINLEEELVSPSLYNTLLDPKLMEISLQQIGHFVFKHIYRSWNTKLVP